MRDGPHCSSCDRSGRTAMPASCSLLRVALLICILGGNPILSTAQVLSTAQIDNPQPTWRDRKYILPILRAGPNNQLRHLRFMLALAKQLNRTLILTGITKHYTDRGSRYKLPKAQPKGLGLTVRGPGLLLPLPPDQGRQCFREEVPYQIEFSEILDRQYVEEFTPVTTTAEMKARGWDGVIDALLYPNATFKLERVLPYVTMTAAAAKVHMYHDLTVATTPDKLHCNPDAIRALAEQINRFRVVMMVFVVIGHNEVVSLPAEGLAEPDGQQGNTCWTDLFQANRRLKANSWVQGIARQYIHEHVGLEPFLAMHVRPQADGCWRHWMNRNFDPKALSRKGVCWAGHDQLHLVLGPKAAQAMAKHQLTKLVVLTHPNLQPVINEMLQKVNLTAVYIVPSRVASIANCRDKSSTFLMLIEMQVAVQSTVFLGTASSSITETVLYERLAMGNTANEYLDRPFPKARPALSPPPPPMAT